MTDSPFSVLLRVVLCTTVAQTTAELAWFAPSSLTAQLLAVGGRTSEGLLWVLTILVVLGIVDIVCNDLTPRWRWCDVHVLRRYRAIGYFGMAVTFVIQAAVCALEGPAGSWVLLEHYSKAGLVLTWYAGLELSTAARQLREAASEGL